MKLTILQHFIEDTSRTFVQQLQDEQTQAWEVFTRVYGDFISSNLIRSGVSAFDVDDIRQEVFLSVAKSVGKFEFQARKASFRAWLKTLAVNRARDYLRKKNKHLNARDDISLVEYAGTASTSEQDESDRYDLEQLYARATAELSNYFRADSVEIFMSLIRGGSVAAIAKETGRSPAAIRQTKVRVLHRLRELAGE